MIKYIIAYLIIGYLITVFLCIKDYKRSSYRNVKDWFDMELNDTIHPFLLIGLFWIIVIICIIPVYSVYLIVILFDKIIKRTK